MKFTKLFTLGLLSVLSLIVLTSIASAAMTLSAITITAPASVSNTATSIPISFTLTNSGTAGTVDLTNAFTAGAGTIAFSPSSTAVVIADGSTTPTTTNITGTITITAGKVGVVAGTITVKNSSDSTVLQTSTYSVPVSFCSAGTAGTDLILKSIDVTSDGSDDEEWMPLDTITVDVTLKNVGDENIDDVVAEIGLFDSNGVNVIGDVDFVSEDDEQSDIGKINDGDTEDVTFEFQLPADFEDGTYRLAVKTFSEDLTETLACDSDSTDMNENFYHEVSVERDEDNPIVVNNIVLSSKTASAGDEITATFKVYNVGTNDEDQVRVNIVSTALGINTFQDIKSGLDVGDGNKMELVFTVPATAKAGNAVITFSADYDFDSRDDEYDESSSDTWSTTLTVLASEVPADTALKVGVLAELTSEAEAGKPLVVSATITNNEATSQTFVIDAKSFSDWASLDSISSRLFTLNAGDSKDVEFTFNVNDDASGEQTFTIETTAGTKVAQKEVSVEISEGRSLFSGFGGFGGNSLIWIIGAINVILIVLIIVLAVKLSR